MKTIEERVKEVGEMVGEQLLDMVGIAVNTAIKEERERCIKLCERIDGLCTSDKARYAVQACRDQIKDGK